MLITSEISKYLFPVAWGIQHNCLLTCRFSDVRMQLPVQHFRCVVPARENTICDN